jgi:uncharacterized protein DUF2752
MVSELEKTVELEGEHRDSTNHSDGDAVSSKRVAAVLLCLLSAVFLTSMFFKPSGEAYESYFTICGFRNLTGLPCPGCGLTHSFCAIGKGELLSAFSFNLLGPPLFALSLLLWVKSLSVLRGWQKPVLVLDRALTALRPFRSFAVAFSIFGIGRIIYVLMYRPAAFDLSPLAKVVARILH